MPADIVTTPTSIYSAWPSVTVETKSTLAVATAWSETAGLYCNQLLLRVNGFDRAMLYYAAGNNVAQIGELYAECAPLDLVGKFVRVQIDSDLEWVGIVVDENRHRSGVFLDAEDGNKRKYRAQDQLLEVAGLEYLLDRRRVDTALVGDTTRLGRSIPFNAASISTLRSSRKQRGNRTAITNSDSVYVFTAELPGSEWTAANIVEYLLKYFGPVDDSGNDVPTTFALDSAAYFVLSDYKPTLDPQGLTVYQCLNAMLNPARGFCWWVEYDDAAGTAGTAYVHVESLATSAVSLPSGDTLPANTNQKSIDFDLDWTARGVRKYSNARRHYNRIRCRGARLTSTFTVGFGDSTLAADWGSTLETAYKDAASGTTGYGALDAEDQEARNDAFRHHELLKRVYSAFRIPSDWDQKSGDGGATSPAVARNWAFADTETTGSILGGLPLAVNALRVLPRTLLEAGVDYSDPSNQVDNNPAGTELDLRPPFALVKVADSPAKYQFADKLSAANWADGTEVGEIKTSYHLFGLQQAPGIGLHASSGHAHACALNHWTGAAPTAHDPEIDYESLIVTLAAEADSYAEGIYPASVAGGERVDELVIDMGDDYRLDFLPENTVVDLAGGDLVLANATTDAGRLLRDDRKQLRDAARMAYEWYQSEAAGLSFTLLQTRQLFDVGTLVTTLGDAETLETVNTVVGSVSYDFLRGEQQVATLGDAIDLPGLLT